MSAPDDDPAIDQPDHGRTELAEDRTVWARRRTVQANERTFAAWIRTGLACKATGFGATRLLEEVEPQWLVSGLGGVLVLLGLSALWLGLQSYRETFSDLGEAEPTLSVKAVTALTALFGVASLAAFAVLVFWV